MAVTKNLLVTLPGSLVWVLAVVWTIGVLNIYNFMDGMDGLASIQAVGAGAALSVAFVLHHQFDLAMVALLVAAASAGFGVQNLPPARIFMGDSGSTFLGFTFAVLGVMGCQRPDPIPFLVTPVALAPFLLDGTFTIVRRLLRREPLWKAHRSHLYQRAVGAGQSHASVLRPYGAWTLASACAACVLSISGGLVTSLLVLAELGALGAIWRWVDSMERRPRTSETGLPKLQ